MAVPITARQSRSANTHDQFPQGGFHLEYECKKPIEDILATQPGEYQLNPKYGLGPNRLYHGDNLRVLATLAHDESVVGKVRLVYIDPPFATSGSFESRSRRHAYDDDLVGPPFMEALRERLVFIHRLLSDDGSLYVHLDGRMVFHTRLLLDEIFGEENFRNFITRKKCNPKNYTRKTYGNVADYILFYSKSDNYVWNRPVQPWDEERANREYQCVDETGRRYKKVPIHAPGIRHGETGREWKGRFPPPGKHWQFTPTTLDEMDNRGEIYWSPNGNPRRKIYLDGSDGIPLQNIWMDVKDAHNQNIHITGYPTEKNPEVLMRIIEASSNPGDLVLDCYSGSGTTLAVASKLHRYWIGVDSSNEAIKTTLFRFEFGTERMGDFVTPLRQKTLPLQSMVADFSLYEQVDRSETDRPETGRVESSSSK